MTTPPKRAGKPGRRGLAGTLGNVLMVVLGTALVAGSGFAVYEILQNVPHVPPPIVLKDVVMVARDVDEKKPVTRDALRLGRVPAEVAPPSVVTALEETDGTVAATKLMPGEMLLKTRLISRAASDALAMQLAADEIAVTFPAVGIASVAGLSAGDRVDVLATFAVTRTDSAANPVLTPQSTAPSPPPFTTTVLADLRVLSVTKPQGAGFGITTPFNVTASAAAAQGTGQVVIAAKYQDALFLKALKDAENAKIDLVLRPVDMTEQAPNRGITLMDGLKSRDITVPNSVR